MSTCFAEAISREARMATMLSPNSEAVTPRANLVLTSEVADGVISTAPVPQGTCEVPIRQAGTKAPSSANHLRNKVANKASSVLCFRTPQALSSLFTAELRDRPWVLITVFMQLQRLKVLPKFLATKLKLKHYPVPITSAVMRRTRHHLVFRFQILRARRWC